MFPFFIKHHPFEDDSLLRAGVNVVLHSRARVHFAGTPLSDDHRTAMENRPQIRPAHPTTAPQIKLNRIRFQFTIRGLLILFAVIGILMVPVTLKLNFFRRQQAILELFTDKAFEPMVEYESVEPLWFWSSVETVLDVPCRNLTRIFLLYNENSTQSERDALFELTYLKSLSARGIYSAFSITRLPELSYLENINMGVAPFDGQSIKAIASCNNLKSITLGVNTPGDGRSIRNHDFCEAITLPLSELPHLEKVSFHANFDMVSTESLIPLLDKTQLTTLSLSGDNGFTRDLQLLARCSSLLWIDIEAPTSDEIRQLSVLPCLETLVVRGNLTTQHEEAIMSLPRLKYFKGTPADSTVSAADQRASNEILERLESAVRFRKHLIN